MDITNSIASDTRTYVSEFRTKCKATHGKSSVELFGVALLVPSLLVKNIKTKPVFTSLSLSVCLCFMNLWCETIVNKSRRYQVGYKRKMAAQFSSGNLHRLSRTSFAFKLAVSFRRGNISNCHNFC